MKILLAYDGSQTSDKALHETFHLGKALGADIVILTVIEPTAHVTQLDWCQPEQLREWEGGNLASLESFLHSHHEVIGSEILRRAVELADTYMYPFEKETKKGSARVVICDYAEEIEADMIVVGSRGLGVIQRMMLGSVSSYVVHNARCSVLVVRGEEEQETVNVPLSSDSELRSV